MPSDEPVNPFGDAQPNPRLPDSPAGNPFSAWPTGCDPIRSALPSLHTSIPDAVPLPYQMVAPAPQPRASAARPPEIRVATGLLLAAVILSLVQGVSGILAVVRLAGTAESLADVEPTGLGKTYVGSRLDSVQTGLIVAVIILALLFALCYAVFARAVWSGRRWPRYVAVALAVFSLFGLLGGPVIVAAVMCGVGATVALWLPRSRAYSDSPANMRARA